MTTSTSISAIMMLTLAWTLAGCRPAGPGGGPGGGEPPPAPVVAVEARMAPVIESISLIGTIAANEEIEVKSETDGVVQEILFEEGKPVEEGHLLVRLDETKLIAELADAEARLKLAENLIRQLPPSRWDGPRWKSVGVNSAMRGFTRLFRAAPGLVISAPARSSPATPPSPGWLISTR